MSAARSPIERQPDIIKECSMTTHAALLATPTVRKTARCRLRNAAVCTAVLLVAGVSSAKVMANSFVFWDVASRAAFGTADGVTVAAAYGVPITNSNTSSGNMTGSNYNPPGGSQQQYVNVHQDSSIT